MINLAGLVELDEATIDRVVEASKQRAEALTEAEQLLRSRFAGRARVSLEEVAQTIQGVAADYWRGTRRDSWQVRNGAVAAGKAALEAQEPKSDLEQDALPGM